MRASGSSRHKREGGTEPKGPFRFIDAPNPVRDKTIKGSGVDLETIQVRVEKAFEDLRAEYCIQIRKDLAAIDSELELASRSGEDERRAILERIYRVSHDIRGQAGTFGYPLITIIGTSLCGLIKHAAEVGGRQLKAIEIHIDAMKAVLAQGITGDGGLTGRELVDNMNKLVAKTLAQ